MTTCKVLDLFGEKVGANHKPQCTPCLLTPVGMSEAREDGKREEQGRVYSYLAMKNVASREGLLPKAERL